MAIASSARMSEVTRILDPVQQDDSKAAEELLPLVLGLVERTATRA